MEILHKVVQGLGESLREYISRFTRATLTVTNFNDQTSHSVFLSNIHPSKQYKYLQSHQNSQSFSALMDAAASHALTEEKLSPLAESTTTSARPPHPSVPRVASTYHLLMKFPTPFGIGKCEGIQTLSWETYRVATSFQTERPKYPSNTFLLGPKVSEKLIKVYDWMECGTVDYGYLTGVIPLGSLDPRDDQFSQRRALVEDLEEEVYIDDMLVKSILAEDHIRHLEQSFQALGKYRMRLNPLKCAFGVESGKFLGFMVNHRGIEANPEKIQTLVDMKSPTKVKDSLLFQSSEEGSGFFWTDECEQSFQELKIYLGKVSLLSKPVQGEVLSLYLAVSEAAVSAALVREEEGKELPVFYVSKALINPETRYRDTKKIALALVVSIRKL
ncbi:hypothetical protein UlMin_020656 [Ulmus minor]